MLRLFLRDSDMRLLTLNTHSWQEPDPFEKLDILVQAIFEQDLDIIALQEINQHQDSPLAVSARNLMTPFTQADGTIVCSNYLIRENNYAYLLKQKLEAKGLHYHLIWDFVHKSYEYYEEGLAILSRHPITHYECINLNAPYDTSNWKHRRSTKVTVAYPTQNVDIFNCHCGWWGDKDAPFQEQIDGIAQSITDNLTFFIGDFNNPAHLSNQGYCYMQQLGWQDTYDHAQEKDEGTTVVKKIDGWLDNTERLRLDFIFSNQLIPIKCSQTIFDGLHYPEISDHFGVMLTCSPPYDGDS